MMLYKNFKKYIFIILILINTIIFSSLVLSAVCPSSKPNELFHYESGQAYIDNTLPILVCSEKAQLASQTDPGAVKLIVLYSTSNSHVEKIALGFTNTYTNFIWVKPAPEVNNINVYYRDSSCLADDEGIFSISSDTNAHVGPYSGIGSYPLKACIASLTCGVEGQGLPNFCTSPSYLNQRDGCCTPSQQSPGFMCRYYEAEAVGTPYPLKCCAQGLETYRMCGTVSGEPACESSSGDIACCNGLNPPSEDDCVYDGICYEDDLNPQTAEYPSLDLTCSEKHWCPLNFDWDLATEVCIPAITMCYTGIDDDFCIGSTTTYPTLTYPYIQDPFNCLYGGPESGPEANPGPLPYEKACCYYTVFGIIYYNAWEDIEVYSRVGGI